MISPEGVVDHSVLLTKKLEEEGIELSVNVDAISRAFSCIVDTTEHDKKIRAEVLDEAIELFRTDEGSENTMWTTNGIIDELEELK